MTGPPARPRIVYRAPGRLRWLVVLLLLSGWLGAQDGTWLDEPLRLRGGRQSLEQALEQIATNAELTISYRNDQLPEIILELKSRRRTIRQWLERVLRDTELTYAPVGATRGLVIFPDPDIINGRFTLRGNVMDANSGERLILANIYVDNGSQGVSSNEFGQYALSLPGGRLRLRISYVGYRPRDLELVLRRDSVLDIGLKPYLDLQPVIVTASTDSMIGVNPDAGGIRIGMTETEQLSGPGGEADPAQVISLLPGITTGADGIGGINIRGSDASENLILLDGVPVYNLNHAGGLFTVFNTQAIRRVDLYKNGLPARFGGRLAGVVDVHTRNGNLFQNEYYLTQSLLATRATVEGPLVEGESSFLMSGRWFGAAALIPELSRRYKAERGRDGEARYRLYDLNFKLNQKLSSKDHLYFSFYRGVDDLANEAERRQEVTVLGNAGTVFQYDALQRNGLNISWGNAVGALRWTHVFNKKLFGNLNLTYSNLGLRAGFVRQDSLIEKETNVELGSSSTGIYNSDIRQVGLAFDGQWLPRVGREIRFGWQVNRHRFEPLILGSNSEELNREGFLLPPTPSHEPWEVNGYAEFVLRRPDLQFRAGLRGQWWRAARGKSHFTLSPRLLYTRRLSPALIWQSTLDVTAQAVHLLGSATIGLPTDIWVPSTEQVAPARAYQFSTGGLLKVGKSWELESAVYAKQMENLVEYLNREDLSGDWEDQVSIGSGRAYGWEVSLRRRRGKFRGWLAYTLARTERTFGEEVNGGRTFPFRYDRLHSFASLLSWHPNPRSSLTLTWRYGSGAAYSFSLASYGLRVPSIFPDNPEDPELSPFPSFETDRNGFRLPPVHRLDLNYRFSLKRKPTAKVTHTFDVGVYNAYDRRNELFYELRTEYDSVLDELVATRNFVKIFIAPVLPIFSYQLHWHGDRQKKEDLQNF